MMGLLGYFMRSMSDTLRKAAPRTVSVADTAVSADDGGDALAEQVDGLLGDIEEVLSVPPPPMTGWSAIPPARPSIDDLALLAEQLEQEREEPDLLDAPASCRAHAGGCDEAPARFDAPSIDDAPSISIASTDADLDDEPTRDWDVNEPSAAARTPAPVPSYPEAPVPPPARSAAFLSEPDYLAYLDDPELEEARDSMPSLVDTIDDTPGTLRPSAVSLPRAHPGRRQARVPLGYAIGAIAAVASAVVAYRLGPHSGASEEPVARHVAVATQRAESPGLAAHAVDAVPQASAALPEKQRLLVTVTPSNAYLSLRAVEDPEGKKTAGPWPKAFDLDPGEYELVAFRAGHMPLVRRITIRPGVRPGALDLRLSVDDIYD